VGPHPDHLDRALLVEDLVHEPMLTVDPAGAGAREVADQLFEAGRTLPPIFAENLEDLLGLLPLSAP
jgi:hypothetical protein